MTTVEPLLPCPFCGGTDFDVNDYFGGEKPYSVICQKCGVDHCTMPPGDPLTIGPDSPTWSDSLKSWNHRPIEDALRARAEAAERERDEIRRCFDEEAHNHIGSLESLYAAHRELAEAQGLLREMETHYYRPRITAYLARIDAKGAP